MPKNAFVRSPLQLNAMLKEEEFLLRQVLYHQHWELLKEIAAGSVRVVTDNPDTTQADAPGTINRSELLEAIGLARQTERRCKKQNLGPWEDFEWGVINGKLSMLRWILRGDVDGLDVQPSAELKRRYVSRERPKVPVHIRGSRSRVKVAGDRRH